MINQNTSVFFMHNFALKSSLAAKVEIVKALRNEMRDYFGKINEFKFKYNPADIRKLIRNLYRLQKKGCTGADLAEKWWPAIENYLSADLDLSNSNRSEFEKKAFLIIILERINKFFNFDFLPKDTEFQIFLFYSLILNYLSKTIVTLFEENVNGHTEINSFLLNRLSYAMNLSVFLHMNLDEASGTVQDLDTEIKVFLPVKKIKAPESGIKMLSILFELSLEEIQSKLNNSLFRASDFSLLASSIQIEGTSVINSLLYNFLEKKINFPKKDLYNELVLSFESALLLIDKLNLELEEHNGEIKNIHYAIKNLVLRASSKKLYQIYFDNQDFLSEILRESVREMAEESGANINGLEKELLKSRAKSRDFYKTINSYLICSCTYYDMEMIKKKFFNKSTDYLRKEFKETETLSHAERETVALAVLCSLKGGVDILRSLFSSEILEEILNKLGLEDLSLKLSCRDEDSEVNQINYLHHQIQILLWRKAKSIIQRISSFKVKMNAVQDSLSELELI